MTQIMPNKLLTKQNLRKIYKLCASLPPFNEFPMPQPHKISFSVINTNEVFGYFHTEPMRIEIDKMCDTWDHIFQTMMHECIHVALYKSNHHDFDQHEAKFNKMAKRICDMYKFDIKEF
jgi:predicted SprT family Zn-dependent metalloprotease